MPGLSLEYVRLNEGVERLADRRLVRLPGTPERVEHLLPVVTVL